MRVVAGLHQCALVVEIDEQIMRVPGEQQLGGALILQLDRVAAIAMHHGADEVRALGAQRCCLLFRRVDCRGKAQIIGRGHARRLLVRQPREPDAHAVEIEDSAILKGRKRRAVRVAQVRRVKRKGRFAHALQKHGLAEIELMIARHQDVRRDHVGERNDVRAAVETGHHRRRERVAAVRDDHMASFARRFGALRLDDCGKARETAALASIGKRLLAHDVEVVEQHERNACAVRRLRPGRAPRGDQRQR